MELHSILLLIIILSGIIFLTYFITTKQKRKLNKVTKQEPRFDVVIPPLTTDNYLEDDSSQHQNGNEKDIDLLLDDPLMQPRVPPINKKPTAEESLEKTKSAVEEIIYLMLAAKPNKSFTGYELHQTLLAAHLRFGAMNIFHRHEDLNGGGKILFSLASAQEPGTFEINNIGAFSGKGLIMFLRLTSNKDVVSAFETMLETARQLAEDLDGEILDDSRHVLTAEKIEKMRKKITEFEQKQITGDLFERA